MLKYGKKWICLMLCLALICTCMPPVQAALTNDSIREKESQIKKAKEEVSGLKSNKTDVEKLKKQLEQSKTDLAAYVYLYFSFHF